jgi:hypothetical protein
MKTSGPMTMIPTNDDDDHDDGKDITASASIFSKPEQQTNDFYRT